MTIHGHVTAGAAAELTPLTPTRKRKRRGRWQRRRRMRRVSVDGVVEFDADDAASMDEVRMLMTGMEENVDAASVDISGDINGVGNAVTFVATSVVILRRRISFEA